MNLKKLLLLAAGLLVVAALSTIFFANPAIASNPLAVAVTNTPLPVQGAVNAHQSGNWNVGVSGTVDVATMPNVNLATGSTVGVHNPLDGNGNSTPLHIRDDDNPAQHPYWDTCAGQANGAITAGCSTTPAPQGKTLVVEEVDTLVQVPSGQGVVPFYGYSAPAALYPLTFAGTDGSTDFYVGHVQTRIYKPWQGSNPNCGVRLNLGSNSAVSCNLSGHLVDTP